MAKGMESNASDDEFDTTSLNDLVELVHEQKGMHKKQATEIKELNALNDLSATLATDYEHLLCKFKFLSKECDELKSKLQSNESKTSNSFELDESSIPCAIPIFNVDASTSYFDLIDESCSPSCNENVVVETCDCLIGKKNDELKQEVKWLQERSTSLMGKGKNNEEQVRLSSGCWSISMASGSSKTGGFSPSTHTNGACWSLVKTPCGIGLRLDAVLVRTSAALL
jgi:hypothetical protein